LPDDGSTRLGRPRGFGADQHDPAELLLEGLDALADGRGRHVQTPGRGIQGSLVHHGGQRLGELEGDLHISQPNAGEES